ncbi:MAG: hypothetical protein H7138_26650, partial [Myxococcales bacterium]|nr:hypothetical protein [Myxococcales bacterium]
APTRAAKAGAEPARDGEDSASEPTDHTGKTGTELARDEQRNGGPRHGGEDWKAAADRGERRVGEARINAPSLPDNDDDESPTAADPELAAAEDTTGIEAIESGGERAGMGRGEAPRKPKSREK